MLVLLFQQRQPCNRRGTLEAVGLAVSRNRVLRKAKYMREMRLNLSRKIDGQYTATASALDVERIWTKESSADEIDGVKCGALSSEPPPQRGFTVWGPRYPHAGTSEPACTDIG